MKFDLNLAPEFIFKAVRSGGKGGQNVNKVSSKVELYFDVKNSSILNEEQKEKIREKLSPRINKEGVLKVSVEAERSQLLNKERAIRQFYKLIHSAFVVRKPRKATKPSKASVQKRVDQKKLRSVLKKRSSKKKFRIVLFCH